RAFNLYVDLPVLPEFVRLIHSTVPLWKFVLIVIGVLGGTLLVAFAIHRSLAYSQRFLAERANIKLFAGVVGAFALLSPLRPSVEQPDWFSGAFGSSVVPRFVKDIGFWLRVSQHRDANFKRIADVQARLARTPSNLAALNGANVLMFLVESYGET